MQPLPKHVNYLLNMTGQKEIWGIFDQCLLVLQSATNTGAGGAGVGGAAATGNVNSNGNGGSLGGNGYGGDGVNKSG